MPQLLSCPNEVLLQLAGVLSHGGLESFALTCKRAFILSADAIAEKKKRYSTITCGHVRGNDGVTGDHPFFTLREILLDESIAVYPTKMLIGDCAAWRYVENWGPTSSPDLGDDYYRDAIQIIEQVTQQAFEMEDLIVSALERYTSILDDSDEFHKKRTINGRTSAAIGLLITMFPNLRLIECSSDPPNCPTLNRILSKTSNTLSSHIGSSIGVGSQLKGRSVEYSKEAERNDDAAEVMKGFQAPDKLRHVKVVGRGIFLDSIAPFLKIASVRIFSGTNINGKPFSDFGRFLAELNASAITKIELENCAIYSGHIGGLLKNVKSLQHFKYNYSARPATDALWTPCDFIWILCRYHNHSLLSLDLSDNMGRGAKIYETGFICYLKKFQVLHTIRLDSTAFIAEGRLHAIPPSTADIFPATMESLTLARPFGKGVAQELLGDFPSYKNGNFPRLSEIVFEEKPGLEEELEKALRHAGIMLRLPDEEGTSEGRVVNPDREQSLQRP